MMRPTTSSASKTHDKTEVKSPPKRTSTLKSKRKSGEGLGEKERTKQINGHEEPRENSNGAEESSNAAELNGGKDTDGVEVADASSAREW